MAAGLVHAVTRQEPSFRGRDLYLRQPPDAMGGATAHLHWPLPEPRSSTRTSYELTFD